MMTSVPSDYALYDIPALKETEFALAVSPCPRIEDSNDIEDTGDSFSIYSVLAAALFREFD
jgi:hypothetical protein